MRPRTLAYLGLGLVAAFLALKFVLPYLLPFLLAAFVAVLIDPVVNWLENRVHLGRGLAVGAVLLLIVAGLSTGVVVGLYRLALEASDLSVDLPGYYAQAQTLIETWLSRLGEISSSLPAPLNDALQAQAQSAYSLLSKVAAALLNSVASLPGTVMFTVVTGLGTFFISRDKRQINRFILSLLPLAWRERAQTAERRVMASFLGYIRAQLVLVLLTTVGSIVGLGLIGAPYALLLGFGAGLLDLFPMVGPATMYLPWALYHVFFGNPGFGLRILAVFAVVAGVRQLLEARVVGARIGIHPLATLMAIYLGLAIFGARGLIIGPLTAIIIKALAESGLWPSLPPSGGAGGRPAEPTR
ncbi:MAG TPA: sporulation integral membrane protein YtvI [Bacillota bacterium]|jgi:sporulation integral membrane protein YtvI